MKTATPRQILRKAFQEKRVAAIHVDLQNGYYTDSTKGAFAAVSSFAKQTRALHIPNCWVANTRDWNKRTPMNFAMKHRDTRLDLHPSIPVAANDYIFEKAAHSAFNGHTPPLAAHLNDIGCDTILITGVIYRACVAETIMSAVERDLQVFAVVDATDCPGNEVKDYQVWMKEFGRRFSPSGRRHQLVPVTAGMVVQTLSR